MDWLPEFVLKYLNFAGKCYRHCDKPTSMKVISKGPEDLIGAYVCPDAFVSQVVYFSAKPNREYFVRFLTAQVGEENLSPRDVRIASRHGWELGGDAESEIRSRLGETGVIHEIYWTRYPRTEEEKLLAVSLCMGDGAKAGCMKLFMHNRASSDRLCPSCRTKPAE